MSDEMISFIRQSVDRILQYKSEIKQLEEKINHEREMIAGLNISSEVQSTTTTEQKLSECVEDAISEYYETGTGIVDIEYIEKIVERYVKKNGLEMKQSDRIILIDVLLKRGYKIKKQKGDIIVIGIDVKKMDIDLYINDYESD